MNYRNKVINNLHTQFTIVMLVSDSLDSYMERARKYAKGWLFLDSKMARFFLLYAVEVEDPKNPSRVQEPRHLRCRM